MQVRYSHLQERKVNRHTSSAAELGRYSRTHSYVTNSQARIGIRAEPWVWVPEVRPAGCVWWMYKLAMGERVMYGYTLPIYGCAHPTFTCIREMFVRCNMNCTFQNAGSFTFQLTKFEGKIIIDLYGPLCYRTLFRLPLSPPLGFLKQERNAHAIPMAMLPGTPTGKP